MEGRSVRLTKGIHLHRRTFTLWWVVILGVHALTCVYNALYAYCYVKLKDTFLDLYMNSLYIGMPPQHHLIIASVHAIMSALHCVCILLMICGSVWQRSLAFTPWSSCIAGSSNRSQDERTVSSAIFRSFSKAYTKITTPCGACGVKGEYFYVILISREIVETAFQTFQAYRMSILLPRMLLNRFYAFLLAVNCWSSVIIHTLFFKHDEARKRFATILLDCVLDLLACMGVELIIVTSYASEYNTEIMGFPGIFWYNDEWTARALNEFQLVVVVSWWDLASRAIFSLGLIMTTASMKNLLWQLPISSSHVVGMSEVVGCDAPSMQLCRGKINAVNPIPDTLPQQNSKFKRSEQKRLRFDAGNLLFHIIHVFFGVWGTLVLGLHIQASMQPTLTQCLMQVRPWVVTRPSCYLVGLDCHSLGINGQMNEVEEKWDEFDSSTVVQLVIRHCPALGMPAKFQEFNGLRNMKVYNTSIDAWGESASITSGKHPRISTLLIVRVNMTDGLLPAGLQSVDFPQTLYDFEFCVTNLRSLPEDLDTKWPLYAIIQLEYSEFTTVPPVLTRLEPYYLALTGNPITQVPPDVFEIQSVLYLGISNMNIKELPRDVKQLSSVLSWVFMGNTEISFFWRWADDLIEQMRGKPHPWVAAGSTYCNDLGGIQNGAAMSFRVPVSPEYSQVLMNSSEGNLGEIVKALTCDTSIEGMFYPLAYEDSLNAISAPPPLVQQW